jgi:uncharacterized protein DUF6580
MMRENRIVARSAPGALTELALVLGLIGLDVIARLLPHAPNFVPIAASALFAGAVLGTRPLAFVVPLAAMALSDCVLGFYDWHVMIVVYSALMVPAAMGLLARRSGVLIVLFPLALASSVIFFITTNFAVWMFSGIYARDIAGLSKCYFAAIPFFQNTLLGDLFWTAILFGALSIFRFVFTRGERRCLLLEEPGSRTVQATSIGALAFRGHRI